MAPDALSEIAVELYALPLAEFTSARNQRAADARVAGDRDLADRIRQLKKPSASAWAVNMLSRHRAKEVSQLLELGASLREAQSELDARELRQLGTQRQKLIAAVVRQARALAEELGDPIGTAAADEVGQTLQAALADPDATEAVTAGLLTRPLASSGWGPVDVDGALAVPVRKEGKAKVTSISAKQRARAKRRLNEAQQLLEKRQAAADALGDELARIDPERDRLTEQVDELVARLAELRGALAELDRHAAALARQRTKAVTALEDATAEVDDAEAELKRLD